MNSRWNVEPIPFANLQANWQDVYRASSELPFLSPAWHQALQESLPGNFRPQPMRISLDGNVVAVAQIGRGTVHHARCISARGLFLNHTGYSQYDCIDLEHNGLLAQGGFAASALAALVEFLLDGPEHWDELSLGWVAADRWSSLAAALAHLPVTVEVTERAPYFAADLSKVDGLTSYLDTLSGNTRYQIRRAMRLYGGEHALQLDVAPDPETATRWLDELVTLHQAYWTARGRRGAFGCAFMQTFHRAHLSLAVASGEAEVLRVRTPEGVLGYLYNLRSVSYTCNYQSGFRYSADGRLKPGLVCHALAMARDADRGTKHYDFLLGGSQYKRSLANQEREMLQVRLKRPRVRFLLEHGLRRIRALGKN